MVRTGSCFIVLVGLLILPGCGTQGCFFVNLDVAPASAVVHAGDPQQNQVMFNAESGNNFGDDTNSCDSRRRRVQADWTVSDPADVQISSAKDKTNGTATCLHATATPVTVTAHYEGKIARAQLSCN